MTKTNLNINVLSFRGEVPVLGCVREVRFKKGALTLYGLTPVDVERILGRLEHEAGPREESSAPAQLSAPPPVAPAAELPAPEAPPARRTRAAKAPPAPEAAPPASAAPATPSAPPAPPAVTPTPSPVSAPAAAPATNGHSGGEPGHPVGDPWGLGPAPENACGETPVAAVPYDLGKMKQYSKLREVLHDMMAAGITTEAALLAECERVKATIPVLSRISDLKERVPRTLQVMDTGISAGGG